MCTYNTDLKKKKKKKTWIVFVEIQKMPNVFWLHVLYILPPKKHNRLTKVKLMSNPTISESLFIWGLFQQ